MLPPLRNWMKMLTLHCIGEREWQLIHGAVHDAGFTSVHNIRIARRVVFTVITHSSPEAVIVPVTEAIGTESRVGHQQVWRPHIGMFL